MGVAQPGSSENTKSLPQAPFFIFACMPRVCHWLRWEWTTSPYSQSYGFSCQFIVIHTVKGFGIINEAEIDVFLELSCFFDDPVDVGNLISGSSAFSKTRLNIWKFTVHVLLKSGLRILSITLLACEMSAIVWLFQHLLALLFFGIGMKTWKPSTDEEGSAPQTQQLDQLWNAA